MFKARAHVSRTGLLHRRCTGWRRPIPATRQPMADIRWLSTFEEDHLTRALFLLIPITFGVLPLTAAIPASPPITNIANFVVKTDNLDEPRRFSPGVLGYDEVFRPRRTIPGPA